MTDTTLNQDVAEVLALYQKFVYGGDDHEMAFFAAERMAAILRRQQARIAELEAQQAPAVDVVCVICSGTGVNHGAQCVPSKSHPTGYKSIECQCQQSNSTEKPHD